MKTIQTTLVLLAVLATSGTAWGGGVGCYTFQPLPSPGEGLSSYLVRLGGSQTFTNINLVLDSYGMPSTQPATVHQVNEFMGFPAKAQKTLWLGMMAPESEPYDTHFMFDVDAGQTLIGNVANETSAKNTSPTGIYTDDYGFYYGLGTFTSTAADGFTLPEILPWNSPFMQIVIPTGSACWLTGTTFNPRTGEAVALHPDPEPGTVAMLFAGVLCLAAMRFRKQRG